VKIDNGGNLTFSGSTISNAGAFDLNGANFGTRLTIGAVDPRRRRGA
jgi:hypothetical protein